MIEELVVSPLKNGALGMNLGVPPLENGETGATPADLKGSIARTTMVGRSTGIV